VDIPQMNVSQLRQRLRTTLLRGIQRGDLTVTLLARRTGFTKSHISRFLHSDGRLSIEAMDRILDVQGIAVEDLIEFGAHAEPRTSYADTVPVVSHAAALSEPEIRLNAVRMMLHLPPGKLQSFHARPVRSRRSWRRFVAVRIDGDDALPMNPLLYEGAFAVIDRHYNSLVEYHPSRPNIYAIHDGVHIALRYIEATETHLISRPLNITSPLQLIEIEPETNLGEYIAGRVVLILNEV
jgi:transcriptional regulator with XRE-family HTH domain